MKKRIATQKRAHLLAPFSILAALAGWIGPAESAPDLALLTSTDGSSFLSSRPVEDDEILVLDPGKAAGLEVLINRTNWSVLFGDTNRDGVYSDGPTEIDALVCLNEDRIIHSAFDLGFSLDTDRQLVDGRFVRDGDLLRLLPGGKVEVILSEQQLANALQTLDDVDIDGVTRRANGEFLFSLDRDIVTLSPSLAARNGSPLLNDHCVFSLRTGAPRAELLFTGDEMLQFVNRTLGTSYVSAIDIQALEIDPDDPNHLLFTTGISFGPGSSTVFTTNRNGAIAELAGLRLSGAVFGLDDEEDLNTLALVHSPQGLRFDTPTPAISISRGEQAIFQVRGATPHSRGRILASVTSRPAIGATARPDLLGIGHLFVDLSDRFFRASLKSPRTRFTADAEGNANLELPPSSRLVGLNLILQAVEIDSRSTSHPIVVRILD